MNWPLILLLGGLAASGLLGMWVFSLWLSARDRAWINGVYNDGTA